MIKVRHSKARRALLLDFSDEVSENDILGAGEKIGEALVDMGTGYTLIEVFHDHARFEGKAGLCAGDMVEACHANNQIWKVVRFQESQNADPGLSILHRTRWKREIPEIETDNIWEAIALAEEEATEQCNPVENNYSI